MLLNDKFLSIVSRGDGVPLYFRAERRKVFIDAMLPYEDHYYVIAHEHALRLGSVNCYGYAPLTGEFTVNDLSVNDDSEIIKESCGHIDFKEVIPELVIEPIINPLVDIEPQTIKAEDIEALRQWSTMWNIAAGTLAQTASKQVGYGAFHDTWESVYNSIDDIFHRIYGERTMQDFLKDSGAVGAATHAYHSSFFRLWGDGSNPFQPCIDLWKRGFVASFDWETWKLHSGPNGEVVFETQHAGL